MPKVWKGYLPVHLMKPGNVSCVYWALNTSHTFLKSCVPVCCCISLLDLLVKQIVWDKGVLATTLSQ